MSSSNDNVKPSRTTTGQADPWADFFKLYSEFASSFKDEFSREPELAPIVKGLADVVTKSVEGTPRDDWHRNTVHEVIKQFRSKSQAILFQEASFFDEPLLLFPEIQEFDVAKLWRERAMFRNGLWHWIEQLYVVGNVCLHPNRKDQFLKAVRQLKATKMGLEIGEDDEDGPEDISGVIDGISNMFGVGDNAVMKDMFGELAQTMHQTMKNTANPMDLLQQMLSGDMSALGDLDQRMEQKIAQKIESGEITQEELQRQREGMLQNFGGLEGIAGMASNLGLNTQGMQVGKQQQAPPAQAPAPPAPAPVKKKKKSNKKKTPTTGGANKKKN
jgi:hypothetical protein